MNIKKSIEIAKTNFEINSALRRMEKSNTYKLMQKNKKPRDCFKYAQVGYILPEKKEPHKHLKRMWENIKAFVWENLGDD